LTAKDIHDCIAEYFVNESKTEEVRVQQGLLCDYGFKREEERGWEEDGLGRSGRGGEERV
jgi:hypothetical protein